MTTLAVLVLSAIPAARAQDCASAPLMGRRAAIGVGYAHAVDEGGVSAGATLGVGARLRASIGYEGTRMNDIDRLRHELNGAVSVATSIGIMQVCPIAGGSVARLSTDRSSTQGRVTTRELFYGASVAVPITLSERVRLIPFVQPVAVRRTVSWESTDVEWIVSGQRDARRIEAWFGATLAVGSSALVVRTRRSSGEAPSAIAVGVMTAIGR